jgi:uncharacterized damage-inducible protein DinB
MTEPSIELEPYRAMFRFNTWANEHLRAALVEAGDEAARRPLGLWWGTLFDLTAHVYGSERLWLDRIAQPDAGVPAVRADDLRGVPDLLDRWRATDAEWERYVASLAPADLAEVRGYRRVDGSWLTLTTWQLLMQLAFHGQEHRGNAGDGFTLLGIRHGPLDFMRQFPIES